MSQEIQTSPLLAPPPTEFPYVEEGRAEQAPKGKTEESDSKLVGSRSRENSTTATPTSPRDTQKARPRIIQNRHETEQPRPVAPTGSFLGLKRFATGLPSQDRRRWSGDENDATSDSSNSSDSSDEEERFPSLRRLNSIKRTPVAQPTRSWDQFEVKSEQFKSRGRVSRSDGRIKLFLKDTDKTGYLAKTLDASIKHHLKPSQKSRPKSPTEKKLEKYADLPPPKLNILIAIIGSRGDIQPFIKIAKKLRDDYGHRVRLATHPAFKEFVEIECGLEFFSLGGDPSELMSFMVKNPGLIPTMETVKKGEIGRRRQQMFEMFEGFWRACINATDDEKDVTNLKMMGDRFPFVADAIIANPPSMAHFHCAERLGIPLHLVFTFPFSPTQEFPHPLANIKRSNIDAGYANFMSYPLVDLMTWQGLGDLVNKFRTKTLGLEEVSTLWAPGQLYRLRAPHTYLWSPGLVPKPADWGPEITIAGYVFLELASSYNPSDELLEFLDAGNVIYIGFGSIAGIDDPVTFTDMVFEATKLAGVRAVISKGWGGVGADHAPENVYMIDNVPHDWLFPRVTAVVHHGGAGTTAAGLKFGKPTLIVPFFGDQPFWADMVARSGAGAKEPIPYKKLTAEKLAQGIKECLRPEAKTKAQEIAKSIEKEGDGAQNAVDAFHQALPLTGEDSMRCDIFPDQVAVWYVTRTGTKLSALAAELLIDMKRFRWQDLELVRHRDWTDFSGPGEPITGASGAFARGFADAISGVSRIPLQTKKHIKAHRRMKKTPQFKHIGRGLVIPGSVAQEKVNQAVPKGERVEDLQDKASQMNFSGNAEPSRLIRRSDKKSQKSQEPSNAPPLARIGSKTQPKQTPLHKDIMQSTADGMGQSVRALLNLPVDVGYAMTRGFHNAPRLYGDETVRQTQAINGFRSGLVAARDELGLGVVDGVTGLVRLPYLDTKRDGVLGLATGLSKGVGGLILKPWAGMLALGTYPVKGIQMEVRKLVRDTKKTNRFIRRGRMVQGSLDLKDAVAELEKSKKRTSPHDLRRDASERWKEIQHRFEMEEAQAARKRSLSVRQSISRRRESSS